VEPVSWRVQPFF
jgi:hypothetical protein